MVEEIDFLKVRNSIVKLKSMKYPRAMPRTFMVNDCIYVLGSTSEKGKTLQQGEKYSLKEDKWKPFLENKDRFHQVG